MGTPYASQSYSAALHHEIHANSEYSAAPLVLAPGGLSSGLQMAVPALWESVIRVADELYG
eukprot:4208882-Prymnesium_polylepis.1